MQSGLWKSRTILQSYKLKLHDGHTSPLNMRS